MLNLLSNYKLVGSAKRNRFESFWFITSTPKALLGFPAKHILCPFQKEDRRAFIIYAFHKKKRLWKGNIKEGERE